MNSLFIIDEIETLNFKKDSTIMMMQAAQQKEWAIHYTTIDNISVVNENPFCITTKIKFNDHNQNSFEKIQEEQISLNEFDVIFMRKEPPFNLEYIYITYALDLAKKNDVLIINDPSALRDANEKFFITNFPNLIPNTLITRKRKDIRNFLNENNDIILKPLDGMGGSSIFRVKKGDPNFNVISEVLTKHESEFIMVQEYLKEIIDGDKRIILIDGQPLDYCLARLAQGGEHRANLAAGGRGEVRKLTTEQYKIAQTIGQRLRKKGILFAGIDLIGNKITEINITCPTCLREIYNESGINGADQLINHISALLQK